MSATTMAVATITETVDPPPGIRPGHAAVPVSDATMPIHTWGRRARLFIVQADLYQFKQG